MATNPYFNNFNNTGEQNLIEDLNIESIRMHGIDIAYLPRTLGSYDDMLNEDDTPEFNSIRTVEMYLINVDNFDGEGDLFSKFGLEIRDSMTMAVAQKRFKEEVSEPENLARPREGDLIYFPLNKKIFEIMHVEHERQFYPLGTLPTYELRVELFEYSNQKFNTGNTEIDTLFDGYNTTGNTAIDDLESIDDWADNETIQDESDEILDFSEKDPFSEGGRW